MTEWKTEETATCLGNKNICSQNSYVHVCLLLSLTWLHERPGDTLLGQRVCFYPSVNALPAPCSKVLDALAIPGNNPGCSGNALNSCLPLCLLRDARSLPLTAMSCSSGACHAEAEALLVAGYGMRVGTQRYSCSDRLELSLTMNSFPGGWTTLGKRNCCDGVDIQTPDVPSQGQVG